MITPSTASLVALMLSVVLAAGGCAAPGTGGDGPATGGGSDAPGGGAPFVARSVADVTAAGLPDGTPVVVSGFFVTDGARHRLCDAVLESYPPQCGGAAVDILGTVPDAVLAALESPRDAPAADRRAWGGVDLTGVLRRPQDGGPVRLELREIQVAG